MPSDQSTPFTDYEAWLVPQIARAFGAIRYLRAKHAGIVHLGHGEDAAREALAITEQWEFLDHAEPEDAARAVIACHSEPVQ